MAVVCALGFADYFTGPYMSFLVLYLIPVSFITWTGGRPLGVLTAFFSVLAWSIDDIRVSGSLAHPALPYWNILMTFIFFLFAVFTLSSLKSVLERQRELARIDDLTQTANSR